MSEDKITINLILTGEDKKKFEEVKQVVGVLKPNTKVIESCIKTAHQVLLK